MARDFGLAQVLVTAVLSLAGCVAQAQQVYDGSEWVKFGCSTYPLNTSSTPLGIGLQNANVVYDPSKLWATADNGRYGASHPNAWNPTPNGVFDGYDFARATYTDSAAAATALATGQKTFNNAINWSDLNASIAPTIVEFAHSQGKTTGTISSVEWSHATPAGLSNAHNVSRNNYAAIALQMVYGAGGTPAQPGTPVLDVIMGCGNPGYDDNGNAASMDPRYVGGTAAWADMTDNNATSSGFTVVQSKMAFENLASGDPAGRYLGIPQVYTTLQQARAGATKVAPYTVPFNANVPTLETMTKAALNILDGTQASPNADGFFLHVEGGAVDWANHANDLGRMIEEQTDFTNSVQAVSDYLEADTNGNNWSNTLVIATADHESGFLLGPDAATVAYDGLVNMGQANMPLHKYLSGSHTNSLVPLYARGPGSELFAGRVDGTDSEMVSRYGLWQGFDGRYVDNTDIFPVMAEALDGDGTSDAKNVILMISDGAGFNAWTASTMYEHGVPEPATLMLLGGGSLAILRGRK
jgi:alkaline phosphatase